MLYEFLVHYQFIYNYINENIFTLNCEEVAVNNCLQLLVSSFEVVPKGVITKLQ